MPTRRGVALLAGSALCWLAGRILGVVELYVVAVAGVVLVTAAALAVASSSARISARRRLSASRAVPGQSVETIIDLRNDSRLPSSLLLLEDACPYALRQSGPSASPKPRFLVHGIRPAAVQTLRYEITAASRGRWRVGPLQLNLRDPFGVVQRSRQYGATSELLVYPQVVALPPGPRLGGQIGSGSSRQRRLLGSGEDFHTVREYRTGDELRRVHWASSARQQRLMVRQNEQPWAARATVLLDARAEAHHGVGEHGSFEAAVTAAASVLTHLAERRYDTKLITTHDDAAPRDAPLDRHLERLADIEPVAGRSMRAAGEALRAGDGLLIAVLAPPPPEPAADPDVRALLAIGRRYGSKAALVTGGTGAGGGGLVTLLLGARWRAATIEGGLAAAWQRLLTQSTHRLPA